MCIIIYLDLNLPKAMETAIETSLSAFIKKFDYLPIFQMCMNCATFFHEKAKDDHKPTDTIEFFGGLLSLFLSWCRNEAAPYFRKHLEAPLLAELKKLTQTELPEKLLALWEKLRTIVDSLLSNGVDNATQDRLMEGFIRFYQPPEFKFDLEVAAKGMLFRYREIADRIVFTGSSFSSECSEQFHQMVSNVTANVSSRLKEELADMVQKAKERAEQERKNTTSIKEQNESLMKNPEAIEWVLCMAKVMKSRVRGFDNRIKAVAKDLKEERDRKNESFKKDRAKKQKEGDEEAAREAAAREAAAEDDY
jgi:hypothetical protein